MCNDCTTGTRTTFKQYAGTLFVSSNTSTASTVLQIVWSVIFINFSKLLYVLFCRQHNSRISHNHIKILIVSLDSPTIQSFCILYGIHHFTTIWLTLSHPCVFCFLFVVIVVCCWWKVPVPFHNDNNDDYHLRRDIIRTFLSADHHGTNADLCEEQEGCGHSGGLVYAVLLHRSSFEFEWWWCAVRCFVTSWFPARRCWRWQNLQRCWPQEHRQMLSRLWRQWIPYTFQAIRHMHALLRGERRARIPNLYRVCGCSRRKFQRTCEPVQTHHRRVLFVPKVITAVCRRVHKNQPERRGSTSGFIFLLYRNADFRQNSYG